MTAAGSHPPLRYAQRRLHARQTRSLLGDGFVEELFGGGNRRLGSFRDEPLDLARLDFVLGNAAWLAGIGADDGARSGLELARTASRDQDVAVVAVEAFDQLHDTFTSCPRPAVRTRPGSARRACVRWAATIVGPRPTRRHTRLKASLPSAASAPPPRWPSAGRWIVPGGRSQEYSHSSCNSQSLS